MEDVGLIMEGVNPEFWKDKRVFLTGHTGFKGSWLSLWLQSMGAEVHGFALPPPTAPALFNEASVGTGMQNTMGDIRDFATLYAAMQTCSPHIVIHMAAQPLVRYSYQAPAETFSTNVMGTVHVLEAARLIKTPKAILNVTTDKCYENREWERGYREDDPMGGHDPYSSSKGCSELVTSAYRRSFFQQSGIALASARAGNVIGGGDWAIDRLVPDILRAFEKAQPVIIRNPHAIRPWQHVLEPLSGYLMLAEHLYTEGQPFAEGWNFGPHEQDARPVQWIVEYMTQTWHAGECWQLDSSQNLHEANYLKLDIAKAKSLLGWQPRWDLATALSNTIDWHQQWLNQANMQEKCMQQIAEYQRTTH